VVLHSVFHLQVADQGHGKDYENEELKDDPQSLQHAPVVASTATGARTAHRSNTKQLVVATIAA
jgi:hypothetical protein